MTTIRALGGSAPTSPTFPPNCCRNPSQGPGAQALNLGNGTGIGNGAGVPGQEGCPSLSLCLSATPKSRSWYSAVGFHPAPPSPSKRSSSGRDLSSPLFLPLINLFLFLFSCKRPGGPGGKPAVCSDRSGSGKKLSDGKADRARVGSKLRFVIVIINQAQ